MQLIRSSATSKKAPIPSRKPTDGIIEQEAPDQAVASDHGDRFVHSELSALSQIKVTSVEPATQ